MQDNARGEATSMLFGLVFVGDGRRAVSCRSRFNTRGFWTVKGIGYAKRVLVQQTTPNSPVHVDERKIANALIQVPNVLPI